MSYTVEDVAILALARARQYTSEVNENRALIYARIGVRQQELFALAGKINPDYFGVCAHAPVSTGSVNLNTIADPVPTPDLIQRIEIYDAGTSAYAVGDEVFPVTLHDQGSAFPPRVIVRDRVMYGVANDLDGVDEVRIYYSRLPASIGPTDKTVTVELPEPHQMLLVVDAERDIYRRSVTAPEPHMARASADEAALLDAFRAHVSTYAGSLQTRYGTQTTAAAP
jgi:hypothetical protein